MIKAFRQHLLGTGLNPSTVEMYCGRLEFFARTYPDLLAVTTHDLEAYLAARRHQAANTRKSFRTSWKVFYDWARREQLVTVNPSDELRRLHIPRPLPRMSDDSTLQYSLLTAPLDVQFMILAGRMGCLRRSEIAALHMSSRQGDNFRLKGKGEKLRNVPINDDWMPVVLKLEAEQEFGYYLPGRFGGHVEVSTVYKKLQRHTGYNPHALRHAGATAAHEATHDLPALQDFLGHASLATTEIYVHTSLKAVRAVAAATSFTTPLHRFADRDEARAA